MAEGWERGDEELGDELVTILHIALLFIAVLLGRELGNIYGTYGEVSQLSIGFEVEEGSLAHFTREVIAGNEADLVVWITFTLPTSGSVHGPVTQLPDYARSWFISMTLSAVVVNQPEVSDIELQLWAEGEPMLTKTFSFGRARVPYLRLVNRTMALRVEDISMFKGIVEEAARRHAGEVEMTFTGRALAHVAFLNVWLPFSTTRYPLVRAPHADYLSSRWTDTVNRTISRMRVGETAYISVSLQNPARVHSVWENITATIYEVGSDKPVLAVLKTAGVAAGSRATYIFPFSPREPGAYYYVLEAPGAFAVKENTPRLEVEKS